MKILQMILFLAIVVFCILLGIFAWQRYQYKPSQINPIPEIQKPNTPTNQEIPDQNYDGKG